MSELQLTTPNLAAQLQVVVNRAGSSGLLGLMDDVAIFNGILTPTEVLLLNTSIGLKKIAGIT